METRDDKEGWLGNPPEDFLMSWKNCKILEGPPREGWY